MRKSQIELKSENKYYQACELLKEAVQLFLEISELEQDSKKIELLRSKTIEFVQDITDLNVLANAQKQGDKNSNFNKDDNTGSQNLGRLVRTADFYLESALAEDERGKHDESTLQLYQQAAAILLGRHSSHERRRKPSQKI